MARPLSDQAQKLIDYFTATPATLSCAARELGIDYKRAEKLVCRLTYAKRVLILRRERMAHCKKPVALYVSPQLAQQLREAA